MRRFLIGLAVIIGSGVVVMWLPSSRLGAASALQFGVRTMTGTVEVAWGDPSPARGGDSIVAYFLFDSAGEHTPLQMDPEVLASVGGAHGINGRLVTVSGTWRDGLLEVHAVRAISPAGSLLPQVAVTGTRRWLVIPCRFGDNSATPKSRDYYQSLVGSTNPALDYYWRDVSYGVIDIEGSQAMEWRSLPQPRSYYVYDRNGDGNEDADLTRLVADCSSTADRDVYFPDYVSIALVFNAELDRFSWGGSRILTYDGMSRSYGITWMADWAWQHHIWAHEMGHTFGFSHSWGSQVYDSRWDVEGSWPSGTRHPTFGAVAVHPLAVQKSRAGWLPAAREATIGASSSTVAALAPLSTPAVSGFLIVKIPILGSSTTYYTVEARRQTGFDSQVPGDAVVIHRVTPSEIRVMDADGNGNPNDAGAMWTAGETFTDGASGVSVRVEGERAGAMVVALGRVDGVNFPARDQSYLFRQDLDAKYRDDLHRPQGSSYADAEGAVVWTQEYLRYRIGFCGHQEAIDSVSDLIAGRTAPATCGFAAGPVAFPPRDETFDFRQQLERIYRDQLRRSPVSTYVDLEGDIVWIQEYLRYRVSGCDHAQAAARVMLQIDGRGVQPTCG